MQLDDAVRAVRNRKVTTGTIVLYGDEPYFRARGLKDLVDAAEVSIPEMNISVFDGRPEMSALTQALGRVPLMSDIKIVVLKETDLLSSSATTTLTKPLENAVIEDHTLFIITAGGKLDKRKGYVKSLQGSALLCECMPLKPDAQVRFIVNEAQQRGLHIDKGAARALADRVPDDLYGLTNELDKLASVLVGQITKRDIEFYVPPSDEMNMFAIYDDLAAGRVEQGHQKLNVLLADDPTPIGFITFLANTFRQMLIARACRDARFSMQRTIDCICSETGAREWSAQRAFDRCIHFTAPKLRENVRLLADVDFGAKQGVYVLQTDLFALIELLFSR